MRQSVFEQWMSKLEERYRKRTQKSARLFENGKKFLPGGDTRSAVFFTPYPFYLTKGEGFKIYDSDGNDYIDFLNNYTALIHGHAHPAIVKAATEQVKRGASFAAPTKSQNILAEMICDRIKSVAQIRFCNTGTEATMNAIRTARILSGKSKIVKVEGGYHGTHDLGEVSFNPDLNEAGPIDRPLSVAKNSGTPKSVLSEVIVVPFNHKEITKVLIREQAEQIACVIIEPMLGAAGCICQENGYLKLLRDLTQELDIFLIFDEVVTYRLGFSGAQGLYEIEPDITAFGKTIGGGFPVGAFGGSKEVMKVFSPIKKGSTSLSGTFNGNPVTVEAGIACLQNLTADVYEHINHLGDLLRKGINSAFERVGIKGKATGLGSLAQIHFNSEEIKDYRSAARGNFQAMSLLHLELLAKGINVPPRGGECSISSPMTVREINFFLNALEESLYEIKPFLGETAPDLIH